LLLSDLSEENLQLKNICGTSWCSGRLIGSPRQRSRVQDRFSTINIHESSHWIFTTLHAVGFSLRYGILLNSVMKNLYQELWTNWIGFDKPRRHKIGVKWILNFENHKSKICWKYNRGKSLWIFHHARLKANKSTILLWFAKKKDWMINIHTVHQT
jgi:hypothetical protein